MKHIENIRFQENGHPAFHFTLPLFKKSFTLDFKQPILIISGDNGCGKSTLLEAIAYKLNLPTIGKHTHLTDSSFSIERTLFDHLFIKWKNKTPHGMFFRAEDYIGFVRSIQTMKEDLEKEFNEMRKHIINEGLERAKRVLYGQINELEHRYNGNLAEKSHGEGFLEIFTSRIHGNGVYILDEPEASLSPMKQLALLSLLMNFATNSDAQFILATHSPLLMGIPNATIYYMNESGLQETLYEETEHFQVYRSFLQNKDLFLRHL